MKDKEQGNIVKNFCIGGTRVKIADDYYRNKTQDDVNAALERIAKRAQEHFLASAKVAEHIAKQQTCNAQS